MYQMEEVRQGWVRQEYRYGAKLEYPEPPQEDYHKQGMQSERAVTPPSSAVATLRAAAEEEREVEERAQRRRADMTREVLQAALAALKESWPAVHNQMERVTKELSTVQVCVGRYLNAGATVSPPDDRPPSRETPKPLLDRPPPCLASRRGPRLAPCRNPPGCA